MNELLDEQIKEVAKERSHPTSELQSIDIENNLDNDEFSDFIEYTQSPKSLQSNEEDVDCMICLDKIDDYTEGVLPCGCNNKFHLNCLQNWINLHYNCPICRKGPNISTENLNRQNDYIIEFMNYFDEHQQNQEIQQHHQHYQHQQIHQQMHQQYQHHQQHILALSNVARNRRTYRDKMMAIIVFIIICGIIYRVITL